MEKEKSSAYKPELSAEEEQRLLGFVHALVAEALPEMDAVKLAEIAAREPELTRKALEEVSGVADKKTRSEAMKLLDAALDKAVEGMGRRVEPFHSARDLFRRKFEMVEALEAAGLRVSETRLDKLLLSAFSGVRHEMASLEWFARRGALTSERWVRVANKGTNFCYGFMNEKGGEKGDALGVVELLVSSGSLKDEPGVPGYTDFAAAGLFGCADYLAAKGFKPRPATMPRRFVTQGMCAAGAYMMGLNDSGLDFSKKETVDKAVERLLWMAQNGAEVSAPADSAQKSWAQVSAQDPLMCLATQRSAFSYGMARSGHVMPLMRAFKEAGVDFSKNPHYLACELKDALWQRGEEAYLDEALVLGADPAKHPGVALAAAIPWKGSTRDEVGPKLFDKMLALGADPKRVEAHCRLDASPVARGFDQAWFALAWRAVDAGAPLNWVSSDDGRTLLHIMAERSAKKELGELAKILERGEVEALIDAQTTGEDPGSSGQTALMRACGVLNVEGAKKLLAAGADPNLADARGWTALRHAGRKYGVKAQEKTLALVRILVEAGADPARGDSKGATPAQAMATRGPLGAIAELLSLRPQDLTGEGALAAKARAKMQARGSEGASLVESVVMDAALPKAAPKAPGMGRSRL